jgi:hypothetical protein
MASRINIGSTTTQEKKENNRILPKSQEKVGRPARDETVDPRLENLRLLNQLKTNEKIDWNGAQRTTWRNNSRYVLDPIFGRGSNHASRRDRTEPDPKSGAR